MLGFAANWVGCWEFDGANDDEGFGEEKHREDCSVAAVLMVIEGGGASFVKIVIQLVLIVCGSDTWLFARTSLAEIRISRIVLGDFLLYADIDPLLPCSCICLVSLPF